MLTTSSISAGDMPSFPSAAMARLYLRMGWFVFSEDRLKGSTSPDQNPFAHHKMHGQVRLRWRASNPGTRSVTQFTRNTDTETSDTAGRHKIISFQGPLTGFDAALMAAIDRPQPEPLREYIAVVVSGMTPPSTFIP